MDGSLGDQARPHTCSGVSDSLEELEKGGEDGRTKLILKFKRTRSWRTARIRATRRILGRSMKGVLMSHARQAVTERERDQ